MSKKRAKEILREYHDAWSSGDVEAGCSFYADNLVVHMGGPTLYFRGTFTVRKVSSKAGSTRSRRTRINGSLVARLVMTRLLQMLMKQF